MGDQAIETSNQFTALAETSAVHFSSTKQLEQVGQQSAKVKLSRGQKCILAGTCGLWVKSGTVFVEGAFLQASTTLHRIYGPSSHALPSIQAISPEAELQLQSLADGIQYLPYIGVRDLWSPPRQEESALTFHVVGHSLDDDPKAPKRFKEFNNGLWKSIHTELSSIKVANSSTPFHPRLLVCGRRSSGLSTFVRCLSNRILAKQMSNPDKSLHKGVIILDLDAHMPEFAPPGMISLVHVMEPFYGPAFTHILPTKGATSRVLRMHFLGDLDATNLSGWHIDRVHDLLDLEEKGRATYRGAPVVVMLPKWLNNIDQDLAGKLWTKFAATHLVCLDTRLISPHLQPWKVLAETSKCSVHQIPGQVFEKMPTAREHDLRMQSYFHMDYQLGGQPFWSETPILAGRQREVCLSYGDLEAKVCGIVLLGGHVAVEDTFDALEGSIVAVVAVRQQANDKMTILHGEVEDRELDSNEARATIAQPGVYRTGEGLPRMLTGFGSGFPIPANESYCVGLAIVIRIDIVNRQLGLITGWELQELEAQTQGMQVALMAQKATSDGRFRMGWAVQEMRKAGREMDDPKLSMREQSR